MDNEDIMARYWNHSKNATAESQRTYGGYGCLPLTIDGFSAGGSPLAGDNAEMQAEMSRLSTGIFAAGHQEPAER